MPTWRRSELERRVAATLALAEQCIPVLTQSTDEGQAYFDRIKFVSETALLLRAASRSSSPALRARATSMASSLAPHARDSRTLTWMALRPALVPELSVAHRCLSSMGVPDDEFDRAVDLVAQGSATGLPERVPWKDLEALWHRETLGVRVPDGLSWTGAAHRASVGQEQDLLFATRDAKYAFTHCLIYLSDFGERRPQAGRPVQSLLDDAEAMLSRSLDEDDFDLAAELLFVWPYSAAQWTAASTFALHVLADVEHDAGLLPSMTLQPESYDALPDDEQRRYFFSEGYHTAYVMGLLMLALLRSDVPVPAQCLSANTEVGLALADGLHGSMSATGPSRQWMPRYGALTNAQRAALVPVVVDAALTRAVKTSDIAGLRRILESSLGAGLTPTPTMLQGAQLLRRLSDVEHLLVRPLEQVG